MIDRTLISRQLLAEEVIYRWDDTIKVREIAWPDTTQAEMVEMVEVAMMDDLHGIAKQYNYDDVEGYVADLVEHTIGSL